MSCNSKFSLILTCGSRIQMQGEHNALHLSCVLVAQSCLDSSQPHGLEPTRLLCPRDSPGRHTGVGCHFLLQGIFPTQELNPGLQYWLADSWPSEPPMPFVWSWRRSRIRKCCKIENSGALRPFSTYLPLKLTSTIPHLWGKGISPRAIGEEGRRWGVSPPSFLIIQGLTKPTVRILDVSSKPESLGLFEVLPCVIFIFPLNCKHKQTSGDGRWKESC